LESVPNMRCSIVFSETRLMTVTGGLVLAPGAANALLQLGGFQGQIAVDEDAGVLEVQARGARIGAQKTRQSGST